MALWTAPRSSLAAPGPGYHVRRVASNLPPCDHAYRAHPVPRASTDRLGTRVEVGHRGRPARQARHPGVVVTSTWRAIGTQHAGAVVVVELEPANRSEVEVYAAAWSVTIVEDGLTASALLTAEQAAELCGVLGCDPGDQQPDTFCACHRAAPCPSDQQPAAGQVRNGTCRKLGHADLGGEICGWCGEKVAPPPATVPDDSATADEPAWLAEARNQGIRDQVERLRAMIGETEQYRAGLSTWEVLEVAGDALGAARRPAPSPTQAREAVARWLAEGYSGAEYAEDHASNDHWTGLADEVLSLPEVQAWAGRRDR